MKNIKLLVFILALCLTASNSMAQEALKGLDEKKDLPTLNKILRRSVRRLNAIENGVSLTSGVTGVLPLANGGTGVALVDPGADRIGFWDDSEGTFAWLTVGTGLTIAGTTISSEQDFEKQTIISWAAVNPSQNISITAGKRYLCFLRITGTNVDTPIGIRFDSDDGADYSYGGGYGSAAGSTGILMGDIEADGSEYLFATFTIDAQAISNVVSVSGNVVGRGIGATADFFTFGGLYTDAGTLTDFEIYGDASSTTGTLIYYQLN